VEVLIDKEVLGHLVATVVTLERDPRFAALDAWQKQSVAATVLQSIRQTGVPTVPQAGWARVGGHQEVVPWQHLAGVPELEPANGESHRSKAWWRNIFKRAPRKRGDF
jgi:hypothetical protein